MNEENKKRTVVKPLILVILVALIAGGAGELLTRTYLLKSAYNIPLLGDINYSDTNRSNLSPGKLSRYLLQEGAKSRQ